MTDERCVDCRAEGVDDLGTFCRVGVWRCTKHQAAAFPDTEPTPRVQARRATILHRALMAPRGLPPHKFTQGMSKDDALQFWVDARAVGLISVGVTARGAKLFALPSYEAPRARGSVKP